MINKHFYTPDNVIANGKCNRLLLYLWETIRLSFNCFNKMSGDLLRYPFVPLYIKKHLLHDLKVTFIWRCYVIPCYRLTPLPGMVKDKSARHYHDTLYY